MPIADLFKNIMASPGGNNSFGDFFQQIAQNAIGGQAGVDQWREGQRQAAQLAQQLNLHNTMTPYEKGQLDLSKSTQDTADAQNNWKQRMDIIKGISSGALQSVAPGSPNSISASSPFEGEADLTAAPVVSPKSKLYTIGADSPLGKAIGAPEDIQVPLEDYLKYSTQYAEKLAGKQDKAAALADIQAMKDQISTQINQRFRPEYYNPIYNAVDPELSNHRQNFQNRLQTALAEDQAHGNSTRLQNLQKDIDSFQSPWEKMQEKRVERDQVVSQHRVEQQDTRSDRSYQFHAGELDRMAKPYEDSMVRVGRLRDTINSGTIQGDALTPAELMIVMAGGQGAGLRINQAEIQQTLGGRNKYDALLATLGQWKPGDKSFSIPEGQKAQMNKLVNLVQSKLQQRLSILNDARGGLVDSNDVHEHRKILDTAHKKLQAVDGGSVQDKLGLDRPPLQFTLPQEAR